MPRPTSGLVQLQNVALAYGFYLLLAALVLLFTVVSNSFLTLSN